MYTTNELYIFKTQLNVSKVEISNEILRFDQELLLNLKYVPKNITKEYCACDVTENN